MITLTESALNHVKKMLNQEKHAGIRVGVKKNGCTGFAYVVEYIDTASKDDILFLDQGILIAVDPQSLEKINGSIIDYVKMNALNKGFEFDNPNVKNICGCGESFSI